MADKQFDYIIAEVGLIGWAAAAQMTDNSDISVLVTTTMARVLLEICTFPPLPLDVRLIFILLSEMHFSLFYTHMGLIFAASLGNYDKRCHLG